MESLDSKIIKQLMKQGRTSWAELGTILGISATAAADRVHRLEERNVIKGYTAIINPTAVGCGLSAFISVILDRTENQKAFLKQVQEIPEIQECHLAAGEEDYLLKVRCSDVQGLAKLFNEKLMKLPGVVKTRTTVIMSTVKETTVLPITSD